MKLMYDLPELDKAAYDSYAEAGEKLMYVVPFNVLEDKFVDGWTIVTDRRILCTLHGKIINEIDLSHCGIFSTEVLYGNCAFYAEVDGVTTLVCRFLSPGAICRDTQSSFNACEAPGGRSAEKRRGSR